MSLRVLLVDDEAPARARLRQMLTERGDTTVVGEAEDGVQALERVQRQTQGSADDRSAGRDQALARPGPTTALERGTDLGDPHLELGGIGARQLEPRELGDPLRDGVAAGGLDQHDRGAVDPLRRLAQGSTRDRIEGRAAVEHDPQRVVALAPQGAEHLREAASLAVGVDAHRRAPRVARPCECPRDLFEGGQRALLLVGQHLVGLVQVGHHARGKAVVGRFVGVVALGQHAEDALDGLGLSVGADLEHLVEIHKFCWLLHSLPGWRPAYLPVKGNAAGKRISRRA